MKTFFAIVALSFMTAMPATASDIDDKNSISTVKKPTMNFDFSCPNYHEEHRCTLLGHPFSHQKSPWLSQLQASLERLLQTREVDAKRLHSCNIEITQDGKLALLSCEPESESTYAEGVVEEIGTLKAFHWPTGKQKIAQACIEFKQHSRCTIAQVLSPEQKK